MTLLQGGLIARRIITTTAVAIAVAAVSSGSTPAAAAVPAAESAAVQHRAASVDFRIVDHNNHHQDVALAQAVAEAERVDATVITLQEVCLNDLKDVKTAHDGLDASGRPTDDEEDWFFFRHASKIQDERCGDGAEDGPLNDVVILTGSEDDPALDVYAFGHTYGSQGPPFDDPRTDVPGKLPRTSGYACLAYDETAGGRTARVVVCSTHLDAGSTPDPDDPQGPSVRQAQAGELRTKIHRLRASGRYVVVAGDFNSTPRSAPMGEFYGSALRDLSSPSTTTTDRGRCVTTTTSTDSDKRADGCWTHRNLHGKTVSKDRIDYVFVDRRLVDEPLTRRMLQTYWETPYAFGEETGGQSDHKILSGRTTFDLSATG